jgi:hypothetical protein
MFVGDVRSEAVDVSIVGDLAKPRKARVFYEQYRWKTCRKGVIHAHAFHRYRQNYAPSKVIGQARLDIGEDDIR